MKTRRATRGRRDMSNEPEPMSDELQQTVDNWLASGHKAPTQAQIHAIMALLDEIERQRAVIAEQQAEIAAMRPIVEAVADIEKSDGSACLQLCDTMYLTTPTESAWRVQHRANCVIEQARTFVAQHPASDEPNAD